MTHPTNLEHQINDRINSIRAEGLRSQQLKRRGRRAFSPGRGFAAKRVLWAAAGAAALLMATLWLF